MMEEIKEATLPGIGRLRVFCESLSKNLQVVCQKSYFTNNEG